MEPQEPYTCEGMPWEDDDLIDIDWDDTYVDSNYYSDYDYYEDFDEEYLWEDDD